MALLTATTNDLPAPVVSALANPGAPDTGRVEAGDRRWTFLRWGDQADPPLVLVHGVTSNAGTWWRVGPALAAAGRRVVAVDMPGHGSDASWSGRHLLEETAEDLAAFIRSAGLARADLAVVGHSWGGAVSARLPMAGVRPAVLVLLDPPSLPLREMQDLASSPTEKPYATLAEARAAVRAEYPSWSAGDIEAKAIALTEFDRQAVLDVLTLNGDWDAGMAALQHPDAAGIPVWLIRGESETGGLIPDARVAAIESQVGPGKVITIAGGPHSPHRTHPEATILAILRALEG